MQDLTNISKREVTAVDITMEDFSAAIDQSFKNIEEGDIVPVTVISVSDTNVIVDLDYYTEGIIPLEELSYDPNYKIKREIKVGDMLSAMVCHVDDENGNVLLSLKRAQNILSWDILKEGFKNKTIYHVTVTDIVNAGVVTYLKGIRGFIPASQLSLEYVENTASYIGKELDVMIIDLQEDSKKLILSAKEVLKTNVISERNNQIAKLQRGTIATGVIEKIVPYGVFVKINDDLSGLVHISEICNKFISTPKEVVKLGQTVSVKIIDIKDGKLSLSMKALEETVSEKDETSKEHIALEYSSNEEASTSLGSLLSKLKL